MGADHARIVLVLTLLGLPAAARAAPAATRASAPDSVFGDTVLVLPEVNVVRDRLPGPGARLPTSFVTELRLGTSGRALETLSDVLSQAAGVHVQQYGGLGAFSVVSLRGAPAGQVAIFLDGAPLTSAAHGVVNLADLPVTAIERVEVYRGASPFDLGAPGAAGAVNLVTLAGASGSSVRLGRGSFGTWEAGASGAGHLGALSGLAHLGYQGTAGNFGFPDDNGTPFNSADDAVSARINNRFDAATGLASLTWRPHGGAHVTARADLFRKSQGVPGLGAVQAEGTSLSLRRGLGAIEAALDGRGARPAVTLRAGLDRERTRFADGGATLGLGRHDTDDRVSGDHVGLDLRWVDLVPGAVLEGGGMLQREDARLHDALSGFPDPAPSRRDSRGAWAGLQIRPAGDHLVLRAARRRDAIEDRLRAVSGGGAAVSEDLSRRLDAAQIGAKWRIARGLELMGNGSQAGRAPDFLELFGNQGTVAGNPRLRPESVESWDAGFCWHAVSAGPARAAVTVAHFESRARDLILYGRNSQSSVRAENASRARVGGEELSLDVSGGGLAAQASFTLERATDRGGAAAYAGKRLPQRPGREGYARLDWTRGRFRVGADVRHLGDNYLDRYNLYRVPSRTWIGASVSLEPFVLPVRLVIEGKNLADRRAADVIGFPLPGRSVFVSCEARLGAARHDHP